MPRTLTLLLFVVCEDGPNANGEEAQLEALVTLRPSASGNFAGELSLELVEGIGNNVQRCVLLPCCGIGADDDVLLPNAAATRRRSPNRYQLNGIPYFVFVRSPGVRRCVNPSQLCCPVDIIPRCILAGVYLFVFVPVLPTRPDGVQRPLPLILNPNGLHGLNDKTADFRKESSMRSLLGADLTPEQQREARSPKRQLVQRVHRALHLVQTVAKAFNVQSKDESAEL